MSLKPKMMREILLIGATALTLLGCSGGTPADIVADAFKAYQSKDSGKLSELMSPQGRANAALLCGGATINCLQTNYGKAGSVSLKKTVVGKENSTRALVTLVTQWDSDGKTRCQEFALEKVSEGWRIAFFDSPKLCD